MTTTTTTGPVLVDPARLEGLATSILEDLGFGPQDARIGARAMVRADLRGAHTHGIRYLPEYVPLIRGGAIRADSKPEIVRASNSAALIDGDAGLGHVVAYHAAEQAITMAAEPGSGVGFVLVRNSNHFGAAGFFSLQIAEAGLVGLVLSNSAPVMAAPGARGPVISNSPISYGFPSNDGYGHIVLDMALSDVAGSRVLMAADRGEPIPLGWLLDAEGQPTTDPEQIRQGGALTSIGGHKGWALALFVEILSGVLSGAAVTHDVLKFRERPTEPSGTGHTVLAVNPEVFMGRDEFEERLARFRRTVHEAPKAAGSDRVLLPGELEHEHELDALSNGLALDETTWTELAQLAGELGRTADLHDVRR
jgi:LDH2 family malate/lactate/ureidoglycolate dehydrogenase